MTSPFVYHEWSRSRGEVARLVRQEFNGHDILHLRIFYRDQDGTLKPTAQGVTIPHDQIAQLRKALRKAKEELATGDSQEVQSIKRKKKSKRRQGR